MAKIPAEFFVFARISSSKVSSTIRLEEVVPVKDSDSKQSRTSKKAQVASEQNHVPILLYDNEDKDAYKLFHRTGLKAPRGIEVSATDGQGPDTAQAWRAASKELRKYFRGYKLEEVSTSGSYWNGSYWSRPKPTAKLFAFGFRVLRKGSRSPIRQALKVMATSRRREDLVLDFVAVVQGKK